VIDVGAVAEFPERTITVVRANHREVGVVRYLGEFFGLRNVCPHQGGPLCRGKLIRQQDESPPGTIVLSSDQLVVSCPWHGWEFDVRTGRCLYDPSLRVATYVVEARGDRVLATVAPSRAAGFPAVRSAASQKPAAGEQ
jgi:nitrite reductase/ring-hydroxylating ferredoxin subunit